ncbi:hypothetical protein [Streptomyces hydrogenans]|uniref:Uncharacterized protein n=1 Tax=Streptomyces hydrogenans TaxID=1873719 RepID=A0ABQ3PJG9_9ACTN|nr:hypothetical protein [Streptomyces hydrogenans]GHG10273.1 hypothetical protein GCM10018784_23750 [Streptomyces hydrogenans]GHI25173.1 hypothetical protein Shyd_65440 [Streptomyces hydrogenans]
MTDTDTVYLDEEPSEDYVQYLRDESDIKVVIWPGGAVALP